MSHIHQLSADKFALNVVVRQVVDEDETYYVAECLEIPGCVADGQTPEAAHGNIQPAIRDCLSVIFQDSLERLTAGRPLPDLTDIVKQGRVTVDMHSLLECA